MNSITPTVLISRELLEDTYFDNIKYCQDIIFWASLAKKNNFKYAFISQPLVTYSLSGRTSKLSYKVRDYIFGEHAG